MGARARLLPTERPQPHPFWVNARKRTWILKAPRPVEEPVGIVGTAGVPTLALVLRLMPFGWWALPTDDTAVAVALLHLLSLRILFVRR